MSISSGSRGGVVPHAPPNSYGCEPKHSRSCLFYVISWQELSCPIYDKIIFIIKTCAMKLLKMLFETSIIRDVSRRVSKRRRLDLFRKKLTAMIDFFRKKPAAVAGVFRKNRQQWLNFFRKN